VQRFLSIRMAQGRAQLLDIRCKSRFTTPIRSAVHSQSPIPGKNGAKLRHLEAAIYLKYLILCFVTQ